MLEMRVMLEMTAADAMKTTWRQHTSWKQLVSHTRYKTKWRAKYERPQQTRVKETHARNVQLEGHTLCENNLRATHAKQTNLKTLEIQLESALCYENNSKATHCDIWMKGNARHEI